MTKMTRHGLTLLLPLVLLRCAAPDTTGLSPRQQLLADHFDNAGCLSRMVERADTITLRLPDSITVDVFPRVLASRSGFVLCNSMGRTVVSVSRRGTFIRAFGRPGAGPGEFRSIVAACLDTLGNVYLVDNLLARLTVFRADGTLIYTRPVANPFLVRHVCATDPGRVALHHAPDSSGGGFVTLLVDGRPAQMLLPAQPGFEAYYYRGHLEGGILTTPSGMIFETNTYSHLLRMIRGDGSVRESERGIQTFKPLPPASGFRAIQELQEVVRRASTIRGLYLVGGFEFLLQELLSLSGTGLYVERAFGIFDTTGAFLGAVKCDISGIESSDGDNLVQVLNPPLPRGSRYRAGGIRAPSIIVLRLRMADHG